MIITKFDCDINEIRLANIDSLLCSSNQCIAELEIERDISKSDEEYIGQKESVELRIYGDIRIKEEYDDYFEIYRDPSQYSDRVRHVLTTHEYPANDIEIIDNNWVEVVYTLNGEYQSESYGDICDGEFGDTKESVMSYLIQMASEIYNVPAEKIHITCPVSCDERE